MSVNPHWQLNPSDGMRIRQLTFHSDIVPEGRAEPI